MKTNNLAESSFVGVTYQVQTYVRIITCNVADIIDMSRNGNLSCPNTEKDLQEGNRGMFHNFPEDFWLTAVMNEMEDAPVTHQADNPSLELQLERGQ